jgi:hypothetical protein
MHRITRESDASVELHQPHGEWIPLLRDTGFEIERLVEIQAPVGARTRYSHIASPEWANQWPSEEAWIARKRA